MHTTPRSPEIAAEVAVFPEFWDPPVGAAVGAAGVEPVIAETTDAPDAAMLLLFKLVTNWLLAM